ncbi:MAG: hypothetical protein U5K27_01975 [Desulfotignum sp.]|nr:hypothetical protein [Desulfotignum sp.]
MHKVTSIAPDTRVVDTRKGIVLRDMEAHIHEEDHQGGNGHDHAKVHGHDDHEEHGHDHHGEDGHAHDGKRIITSMVKKRTVQAMKKSLPARTPTSG